MTGLYFLFKDLGLFNLKMLNDFNGPIGARESFPSVYSCIDQLLFTLNGQMTVADFSCGASGIFCFKIAHSGSCSISEKTLCPSTFE